MLALIRQKRATETSRPAEWHKCKADPAYFLDQHAMLFNATHQRWEPFRLWPAQRSVLRRMADERLLVVLKARQLGLTWLSLGYLLWQMIFRPSATVGIFSRIETDAQDLLDQRLKGIYDRLPDWAKVGAPVSDSKSYWHLSNGSTVRAFATTGGRSYTFSHLLVDEADFQPDLAALLGAVEPTIDAGGQMLLISTVNKAKPMSRFKAIYRAAKAGENTWSPVFLPWHARPERTTEWYETQRTDTMVNTGSLDDLHEEYPASDTEALAARSKDKRIPPHWIEACYVDAAPVDAHALGAPGHGPPPSIPGLDIYVPADPRKSYVIGADPAEGNPNSDDSAATVADAETGEEVARIRGKSEPAIFATYLIDLARYYCDADILVERQNHGHAVMLYLREHSHVTLLRGHDGKEGWSSNALGKSLLYNEAVTVFRDAAKEGQTLLHSFDTYTQLASIEGATLRAPEGMHDDLADAFALAQAARSEHIHRREAGTW